MELTSKTFVGLANSADVQLDPTKSAMVQPLDSESNQTALVTNESHRDMAPPPLITLDSPDDVDQSNSDQPASPPAQTILPHQTKSVPSKDVWCNCQRRDDFPHCKGISQDPSHHTPRMD